MTPEEQKAAIRAVIADKEAFGSNHIADLLKSFDIIIDNGGGSTPGIEAVLSQDNNAGGLSIVNLADPVDDQDLATKKYVDDNSGGGGGVDDVLSQEQPLSEDRSISLDGNKLSITDVVEAEEVDILSVSKVLIKSYSDSQEHISDGFTFKDKNNEDMLRLHPGNNAYSMGKIGDGAYILVSRLNPEFEFLFAGGNRAMDIYPDAHQFQIGDIDNVHNGSKIFIDDDGQTINLIAANGVQIASNKLVLSQPKTPSSASDQGDTGQIAWDSTFIYICVASNTWKRVAIATW